jgi:hypothetical protein
MSLARPEVEQRSNQCSLRANAKTCFGSLGPLHNVASVSGEKRENNKCISVNIKYN